MGVILLLLIFLVIAFGVSTGSIALIYRGMYKKLRYLALSSCEFKEKKGDLVAHHPLMNDTRWEFLTEAYSFAAKPRDHRDENEDAAELENFEQQLIAGESDQYQPPHCQDSCRF